MSFEMVFVELFKLLIRYFLLYLLLANKHRIYLQRQLNDIINVSREGVEIEVIPLPVQKLTRLLVPKTVILILWLPVGMKRLSPYSLDVDVEFVTTLCTYSPVVVQRCRHECRGRWFHHINSAIHRWPQKSVEAFGKAPPGSNRCWVRRLAFLTAARTSIWISLWWLVESISDVATPMLVDGLAWF